jgi:hypothetical protein
MSRLLLYGTLGILLMALLYFFVLAGGDETQEGSDTAVLAVPSLDFSRLEEETLSLFRSWSVIPVTVGTTGKQNPFSGGE